MLNTNHAEMKTKLMQASSSVLSICPVRLRSMSCPGIEMECYLLLVSRHCTLINHNGTVGCAEDTGG